MTLPKPDEFGNFWLGVDHITCSALFPEKELNDGNIQATGRWSVRHNTRFLSDSKGFRRMFRTFDDAVAALRRALTK